MNTKKLASLLLILCGVLLILMIFFVDTVTPITKVAAWSLLALISGLGLYLFKPQLHPQQKMRLLITLVVCLLLLLANWAC